MNTDPLQNPDPDRSLQESEYSVDPNPQPEKEEYSQAPEHDQSNVVDESMMHSPVSKKYIDKEGSGNSPSVDEEIGVEKKKEQEGKIKKRKEKKVDKRKTKFCQELDGMPDNDEEAVYFPWNVIEKKYDCSKYKMSFSDGLIPESQVREFLKDVNKHPLADPTKSDPFLWYMFGGFLLIIGAVAFFANMQGMTAIAFFTTLSFTGFVLIAVLVFLIIRRSGKRKIIRETSLKALFNKHIETTFVRTPVKIELSRLSAYIKLEFAWRIDSKFECESLKVREFNHDESLGDMSNSMAELMGQEVLKATYEVCIPESSQAQIG